MSKTLYEELLSSNNDKIFNQAFRAKEFLDQSEIFNIDNVAKYLIETSSQENWDLSVDFPNIAPPFDNFFMEYTIPPKINNEGTVTDHPLAGTQVGLLFISNSEKPPSLSPLRWVYNVSIFHKNKQFFVQLPFVAIGFVDNSGKALSYSKEFNKYTIIQYASNEDAKIFNVNHVVDIFQGYAFPAFLAISFLHCKNVTIINNQPIHGKRDRHKKRSLVTYKTLEIEPMKQILRTEGRSEETGLKLALHICRGHFKDYREGRGLFGRYKDIYWWDSQVRGNLSEGIVDKDYQINAPDSG